MDSTLKRTWAEIDLDALEHNYRVLRAQAGPQARFLGVVKADAYGHGAIQVARTLEKLGAEYLAVSNIDEARELRLGGVALPILQLGLTPTDEVPEILQNCVTQTIYSESAAQAFSRAAQALGGSIKVHIKLDTGMSRLGFQCDDAHFAQSLAAIGRVCALPGLEVEGIFTHFAAADEPETDSQDYTRAQYDRFQRMVTALSAEHITFPICHCANSGATLFYPEYACGMVRPGLLTYGIGGGRLDLRPVMALKSAVGAVQTYAPGTAVSYGRTFHTQRPTRLGVLPIGYADGLPRALSNRWRVYTPLGMAPIVGRICMDMCMIDLTDLPQVGEGTEVEVYGPHNDVDQAAGEAGTIPYELTCAVSKRVPRVYLRHGKEISRELLLRG